MNKNQILRFIYKNEDVRVKIQLFHNQNDKFCCQRLLLQTQMKQTNFCKF